MKRTLTAIAITSMSFLFVATKATAGDGLTIPTTVGELYTACLKVEGNKPMYGEDMFYGGYCLGIIQGWRRELEMNCVFERNNPLVNKADVLDASPIALAQAFINYAKDNPQAWDRPGLGGLTAAFQEYFPCTK